MCVVTARGQALEYTFYFLTALSTLAPNPYTVLLPFYYHEYVIELPLSTCTVCVYLSLCSYLGSGKMNRSYSAVGNAEQ